MIPCRRYGIPQWTGPSGLTVALVPALVLALVLGLLAAYSPLAPAAGAYKWTDANGKVHYGDRPPGDAEAEQVQTPAAPEADAGATRRQYKQYRLLRAFAIERRRKQAAREESAEEARKRSSVCGDIQRHLASAQRANLLYRTGKDGERIYLNDEDRQAHLASLSRKQAKWCR